MPVIFAGSFSGVVLRFKRVVTFLLVAAVFGSSAFAQKVQIKNVAVVETQIDEQSGVSGDITQAEIRLVTTELRGEAVRNLPRDRFNVMTSETVQAMGAAVLEECAGENCVIALGSKIGADYIVRGLISKFRDNFTLSIEMYETEYGMLVVTAAPIRTANLDELLERAAAVCAEMYRDFLKMASVASTSSAAVPVKSSVAESAAVAELVEAPLVYTLNIKANPSRGGTITRSPSQTSYASKTPVTVTAMPEAGYRFTGWSGTLKSESPKETVVIDSNMTLTANFSRQKEKTELAAAVAQMKEPKKSSPLKLTMRISGATLAAGGFIGGYVCSNKAESEYKNYKDAGSSDEVRHSRKNTEKLAGTGNVLYTVGWIGLSGLTLSLFF